MFDFDFFLFIDIKIIEKPQKERNEFFMNNKKKTFAFVNALW